MAHGVSEIPVEPAGHARGVRERARVGDACFSVSGCATRVPNEWATSPNSRGNPGREEAEDPGRTGGTGPAGSPRRAWTGASMHPDSLRMRSTPRSWPSVSVSEPSASSERASVSNERPNATNGCGIWVRPLRYSATERRTRETWRTR